MDDGILSIRWDTGYMDIDVAAFFPCAMPKFKKLLKVIDLDAEHADTLKENLKIYFQENVAASENRLKMAENTDEAAYKAAKRDISSFERLLRILDAHKK